MRTIEFALAFALTCALLVTGACSSSNSQSGGSISTAIKVPGSTRIEKFNPVVSLLGSELGSWANTGIRSSSLGQAPLANLSSLQFLINGISICEGLTTSGSGFTGTTGCLTIYQNTVSAFDYNPSVDYSNLAAAANADTTNFIDLASATSRARLNPSTTVRAGSYNWGIVTWYPVVKVNATVPINGGGNLYTHPADAVGSSSSGYISTTNTSMLNPPAALTTVMHTNGGSYFRFQNPFVISDADVSAGTPFNLDLAFNPDGIIKGFTDGMVTGDGQIADTVGSSGHDRIYVPFLELTPIAHKNNDTVMREHYLLSYSDTVSHVVFDVRFDLYYLSSNPSTIYGIEAKTMYNATSASGTSNAPPDFPKIVSITNDTGAHEYKFLIPDTGNTAIIQHFLRLSAVGTASTNVTMNCSGLGAGGIAFTGCSAGSSVTLSYQLVSVDTL